MELETGGLAPGRFAAPFSGNAASPPVARHRQGCCCTQGRTLLELYTEMGPSPVQNVEEDDGEQDPPLTADLGPALWPEGAEKVPGPAMHDILADAMFR